MNRELSLKFPHELRIKKSQNNIDFPLAKLCEKQGLGVYVTEDNKPSKDGYHATVVFTEPESLAIFNKLVFHPEIQEIRRKDEFTYEEITNKALSLFTKEEILFKNS